MQQDAAGRMPRYAVLGAGAAGLTLALRLAQAGAGVTVYEREPLPGGLAAGFRLGAGWLEKFYHHIFATDRDLIALIHEVGLGDRLVWGRPRTSVLLGGREHQLDSPGTLLRFDPLAPGDRLRMAAALAALKLLPDPAPLAGQTAAAWMRRWMGVRGYETVWRPLLRAKFGARADEITAAWFWARVHDRTTRLGYLRGGFQQLYLRLADRLRRDGGSLRLGVAVERIEPAEGRLVVTAGGASEWYDGVVSTLPTRVTVQLTPALPEWYGARYGNVEAYGARCLVLALDRPLTNSYWLNVNDPGYPFMVLVEHTNYQPAADYDGRHIVYLGSYRPMHDPRLRQPLEAARDQAIRHLGRINPAFDASWVCDAWQFTAPFAQPVVTRDYRDRIPPAPTPIPGLFVANMFQVYPHDRGQNYSVALAERLAGDLLAGTAGGGVPLTRSGRAARSTGSR